MYRLTKWVGVLFLAALFVVPLAGFYTQSFATEEEAGFDLDGPQLAGDSENASNPLAAVSNTDIRWQHLDLVDGLAGIGGDRTFDWGVGTGLRFKYCRG